MQYINEMNRKRIEWLNGHNLHTSIQLLNVIQDTLGVPKSCFADNLAIISRGARSGNQTFSLLYFFFPENLNAGYLNIAIDQPYTVIKWTLESIKKAGSLDGYFDAVILKMQLASDKQIIDMIG